MLELDPKQVRNVLKQTIKKAREIDPEMLASVLQEVQNEESGDAEFESAIDDIFEKYGTVFKALA